MTLAHRSSSLCINEADGLDIFFGSRVMPDTERRDTPPTGKSSASTMAARTIRSPRCINGTPPGRDARIKRFYPFVAEFWQGSGADRRAALRLRAMRSFPWTPTCRIRRRLIPGNGRRNGRKAMEGRPRHARKSASRRRLIQAQHRVDVLPADEPAAASTSLPHDTGDFRLMDQQVVEVIRLLPERARFMKGLFAWVGFSTTQIFFDRPARAAGDDAEFTSALLCGGWRKTAFFLSPRWPLRCYHLSGRHYFRRRLQLCRLVAHPHRSFAASTCPATRRSWPPFYAWAASSLICLGILGEYLGRVYREVKQRPLYVIEGKFGGYLQPLQPTIVFDWHFLNSLT